MELEIWLPRFRLALSGLGIWEYFLLAFCGLVTLILIIHFRREFARLTRRRVLLFVGLLVAPLLVNCLLVLDFPAPDLLPPPNVPLAPIHLAVPLLGVIPILAAAAWLGAAPALLVGLVSGILRTDMTTAGIAEPFCFAFFGALSGFHLRQEYRGKTAIVARQPIVAALVPIPVAGLVLLLAAFAHTADAGLAGLDYAATLASARLVPMLVESVVAAGVIQALYLFWPHLRPVRVTASSPPFARSLSLRLVFIFVPLTLVMTFVLVYAVATISSRLMMSESVNNMARDASIAAEDIPYFIYTGQGLLTDFAGDDRLWSNEPLALEARLSRDVRTGAFFDQLLLLNQDGQPLAMYPLAPVGDPDLTVQEEALVQHVLDEGAIQISPAHRSRRREAILSFLAPVEPVTGEEDTPLRVLVGRIHLDVNPLLNHILYGLQWTGGQGQGFIVDLNGYIVSHSDPNMLLTEWRIEEDRPHIFTGPGGWAYESRDPRDNTRQLIYYMPVEGYPWAVVIQLPYEVVLERAQRVASPLLLLLFPCWTVVVIIGWLVVHFVTRPLMQLTVAAERIAEGDLARPVQVSGDDEVGRVGQAFEGMRVRLKTRMDDLSLLFEIGQTVAATLDLSTGMPVILLGALRATGALVARAVLLPTGNEPLTVIAMGQSIEELEPLDRALAEATQGREQPLIVENLARARTLGVPHSLNGTIKAIVALPVRTKGQASAVMWVGYGEARRSDDLEVGLLSTLATQAAVLVENTRLFRAAEGGRRQLAAILNSATDAVLVADQEDRILLVNPAAERAFGITAGAVTGQRIEQSELDPALVQAFKEPLLRSRAPAGEIPLPDGRTLHASLSTISGAGGERIGRVAVLHDITRFKELDEMKSEFLATVSHDLRAPLIYMRGYANMLLAMSHLDDKQREYVEKILYGVEQINELVSDLLDLGRIETGVGLERKPCHLAGVLIEAVDGMRARAAAKEISLRLEPAEGVAIVPGDAALLRQAVTNLVDNAIKYTPSGGIVTVGLSVRADGERKRAVIRIADTGIGIAPEDQMRLFEKFYRIKQRSATDISGTGLGLALVKSIVERHGGKVWVDSELNEGSTFFISLPLNGDGAA
jgi:PAS domain S-box-containing protein